MTYSTVEFNSAFCLSTKRSRLVVQGVKIDNTKARQQFVEALFCWSKERGESSMSIYDPVEIIEKAVARLRSAAWASGVALMFACWGLGYGVSSWMTGFADASLLLLSVIGMAMSVPVVLDVLVRLGHCQADNERWPDWLLRLASTQPFRPLPVHLIDEGDKPADHAVDSWLEGLGNDYAEVKAMAEKLRNKPRGLDTAAAVNLWLFAKLRRRQLTVGLLTV